MREITQLPVGEAFSAGWRKLREVIDHLRCLRPIAGNGIRITERPNGFIIDSIEKTQLPVSESGTSGDTYTACVVRVTSAGQDGSYTGVIIAGGEAGETVTFYLPASLMGQTLAVGTIVLAAPVDVPEAGEDDD